MPAFSLKKYIKGNLCQVPDNLQLDELKYFTNSKGNGQNNLINVLKSADVTVAKEMTREEPANSGCPDG